MSAAELKEEGNKKLQEKDFDGAVDSYSRAIALDPSDHIFYSNRSAAYLSRRDAGSALVDARKCVELSGSWPKGYSRLGAALQALLRFEEAEAAFEAGLRVSPGDAALVKGLEEARKAKEACLHAQRTMYRTVGAVNHDSMGGRGVCLIPPNGRYSRVVIWLHGLGDTANGWASAMPSLGLTDTKFILPTAPTRPISLNMGMNMTGWSDILGLSMDAQEDKTGFDNSAARIRKIIESEVASGVDPSRIIIGGFSQGGALSFHVALRTDIVLGGCVALSTWLPLRADYPSALSSSARNLRVLQVHGDYDQVVPYTFGKLSNDFLATHLSHPPKFVTIKGMGHSSDEEEMDQVRDFIKSIFA